MLNNLYWNQPEQRLRAGWRILIQILLTAIPLAILGFAGFYSEGNQNLRVALTAGPITVLSVFICSRYIDKRKFSNLGILLGDKAWWTDYGFGILASFISASSLVLMLMLFGWGEVMITGRWRYGMWSFIGSFLVGLISYLIVGIFEELMRTYQVKNTIEGLSGRRLSLTWTAILALLVGAIWSVFAHVASLNPSFLVFTLITAVIYGLYFLWTGRAALAMGIHFAWDFTLSTIFQFGANSEASLFSVRLSGIPDFPFEMSSLLGIAAKLIGFLLVLWWILKRKEKIQILENLVSPALDNIS